METTEILLERIRAKVTALGGEQGALEHYNAGKTGPKLTAEGMQRILAGEAQPTYRMMFDAFESVANDWLREREERSHVGRLLAETEAKAQQPVKAVVTIEHGGVSVRPHQPFVDPLLTNQETPAAVQPWMAQGQYMSGV